MLNVLYDHIVLTYGIGIFFQIASNCSIASIFALFCQVYTQFYDKGTTISFLEKVFRYSPSFFFFLFFFFLSLKL